MLDSSTSARFASRLASPRCSPPLATLRRAAQPAWAGGTPATGTTTDKLLMITGSESKTDDGDYLSARDGLATTHRYFVEVPATATRFRLDLFDMDLLVGGTADRLGERDRPRVYRRLQSRRPLDLRQRALHVGGRIPALRSRRHRGRHQAAQGQPLGALRRRQRLGHLLRQQHRRAPPAPPPPGATTSPPRPTTTTTAPRASPRTGSSRTKPAPTAWPAPAAAWCR